MIADPQLTQMTPEDYLEWETRQELRYEYCSGEVFAIAGGTKTHDKLAFNWRRSLSDQVEAQGCDMTGSDVKVLVKKGLSYCYLDLAISCDEQINDALCYVARNGGAIWLDLSYWSSLRRRDWRR